MKRIFILIPTLFLLFNSADAQIGRKWKDKLNKKIEEKTNQTVDRLGNKIDEKVDQTVNRAENKAEDKIDGILEGRSGGGNGRSGGGGVAPMRRVAPATGTYNFDGYIRMKVVMDGPRARHKGLMTQRMDFGKNPKAMSISEMSSDNTREQEFDRLIIDFENQAMYTFMSADGQKYQIGIGYNAGDLEAAFEEVDQSAEYKVNNVTRTGRTKTILGHVCEGFLVKSRDTEMLMWITKANLQPFPQLQEAFQRRGGRRFSIEQFPVIQRRLQAGGMMLESDWKDLRKNTTTKMTITEYKKNSRSSFNPSPYRKL